MNDLCELAGWASTVRYAAKPNRSNSRAFAESRGGDSARTESASAVADSFSFSYSFSFFNRRGWQQITPQRVFDDGLT